MAKIVILGGGFAALAAAEVLANRISDRDEIVLVSKNDKFVFYPGLVPLVFGHVKQSEVIFDLRSLLRRRKIRFVRGEIIEVNPVENTVRVLSESVEEVLNFDFLLIALGRKLETRALPGFAEHAHHILSIGPALDLKHAIANFDSGSIVVGLCPDASLPVPVCEAALGFAQRFRGKITDGDISVKIVFPSTLEKALAGAGLFRDLETEFDRKGIHLVCDFPITSIHQNAILDDYGSLIDYDLLMLMPAFVVQKLFKGEEAVTDSEGFIRIDDQMQVAGFDRIYAAGDIISLAGPRFGYMAMRQGKVAAENIIARLRGEAPHAEYNHEIEWIIGESYTDPVFFHYGFWDNTLDDFDENAFFGMAKLIRERYGVVKNLADSESKSATSP
ncbi:MAG TPA: FAD-dependent oxidoreductase [Pyrinomonadaceae bacterium]|jgi:sulfide:quinone oxidoreductase|nr:FAD-dependent oxidoreductase [Pyrinomonadaceae bacterium]